MKRNNKGITLMALIITIVLLLILSTITIRTINGEGIIGHAKNAREKSEIEREKEIITIAVSETKMQNLGDLNKEDLEKNLDKHTNANNKTKVYEDYCSYIVEFEKSKRVYKIDESGNLELISRDIFDVDNTPGELAEGTQKDENGNDITVYKIESIEDLVAFSKQVNSGNLYSRKTVVLTRTLDFKSYFSYNDYKTNNFGDLNGDEKETDLITELTTGTGFTPIGSGGTGFSSVFNGNNNAIKNIKIDVEGQAGFFGNKINGIIENLKIEGNIKSSTEYAGGLIGCLASKGNVTIRNCYVKGNVTSIAPGKNVGGFIGYQWGSSVCIENCQNYANISGNSSGAGGFIGDVGCASGVVKNSCNFGNVTISSKGGSHQGAGGIIGKSEMGGDGTIIENCYNAGKLVFIGVTATGSYRGVGGMVGYINKSSTLIRHSMDFGEVEATGTNIGGMIGRAQDISTVTTDLKSCYYKNTNITSWLGTATPTITEELAIGKSAADIKSKAFVDELNSNIENGCAYEVENAEGVIETITIDTTGWAKWKYNENSYPTLDLSTTWNGSSWE